MTGTLPTRTTIDLATTLSATLDDIDRMSMDDRLEFLRALRTGPGMAFNATHRWTNLEGVVTFFRDNGLGAPGSWVSLVNAGVLEDVQRGLALAGGRSDVDRAGGAGLWCSYLLQLREEGFATRALHDTAWSHAKEASTDYGLEVARQRGLRHTEQEERFLRMAQLYNWGMRNRSVVDFALTYGGLLDHRLKGIDVEFVDVLMNQGDADAARRGCEIAWTIAQVEPSPAALALLDMVAGELPRIAERLVGARKASG